MIEIILAIAVIAIGISSVMGLFTTGLRMGNNATMSSNAPNFTDALLSHVRLCVMNYGVESDVYKGWKTGTGYTSFDKLSGKPWDEKTGLSEGDFAKEANHTIVPANKSGEEGKAFLYRQFATDGDTTVSVFSAIAEVRWVDDAADIVVVKPTDNLPLSLKTGASGTGIDTTGRPVDATPGYAWERSRRVVEVRISYPADLPPEAREKKIYRLDVYNDKYDRFICEKENAAPGT